jgi:hypothetical protein
MIKTAQTIKPGDIFRCEYGDFNNYCNFVFVCCTPHSMGTCITVRYVNDLKTFDVYDLKPIDKITFNVIGKEG